MLVSISARALGPGPTTHGCSLIPRMRLFSLDLSGQGLYGQTFQKLLADTYYYLQTGSPEAQAASALLYGQEGPWIF